MTALYLVPLLLALPSCDGGAGGDPLTAAIVAGWLVATALSGGARR